MSPESNTTLESPEPPQRSKEPLVSVSLANWLAYDIETNGLPFNHPDFKVLMVGIDDGTKVKVYKGQGNIKAAVYRMEQHLRSGQRLVGHNASFFDRAAILQAYGVNLKSGDTMFLAYLLDEEGPQKLEPLVCGYLGVAPWKDAVTWKWEEFEEQAKKDPQLWVTMGLYNARDTRYTRLLGIKLYEELEKNAPLCRVYNHILLPASRVLSSCAHVGLPIHTGNLIAATQQFTAEKNAYLGQLKELAQENGLNDFNPNSSNQVSELFFTHLGYSPKLFTDSGKPSTNEHTLKLLQSERGGAGLDSLLAYRKSKKSLEFLKRYDELTDRDDGRIHPSYSLTYTVTGRTSSFRPNIQQMPRDSRIRSIIGFEDKRKQLLSADFSQMELRLAAWIAGEENLLQAFRDGADPHMLLAQEITGKPAHQVTKEERTSAKTANFAFLFGGDAFVYQRQMLTDYEKKISYQEAESARDRFHARWPGFVDYYRAQWDTLSKHGCVTSPLGRIRHLQNSRSTDEHTKTESLRQAINFPVQSFANDCALIGLILLAGAGYQPLAYVHDAVLLEVGPEANIMAERVRAILQEGVQRVLRETFKVDLTVPLKVDVTVAPCWQ